MGCSRCNRNRRINTNSNSQINDILNDLESGLCKITIKRINENNPKEIYCTRQKGTEPSDGSSGYRVKDTLQSVRKNGSMLVWALNSATEVEKKSQSGWLKIKTDQIISYDFIGEIPKGI
jgi:hypothetical protein|tara:strand:+ start:227 stop:586 length:360 start_codon:yes stop_codon:yes gene_type:complete